MRSGGYPSKRRRELLESGGTLLILGPIGDGDLVQRSGATLIGFAGSAQGSIPTYVGSTFVDSVRAWAIGSTSTTGLALDNTTAATAGDTLQFSPGLMQAGAGWDTDDLVSRGEDWMTEVRPTSGAAVTSVFHFLRRQDAGAWGSKAYITSAGVLYGLSLQAYGAYLRNKDNLTGLGTTTGIDISHDSPLILLHTNRTDGASNVVAATVYDRNAAAITNAATMRFSWGWTNNVDTYTELASIRLDGAIIGQELRAAADLGGLANHNSLTNVTLAAGANGPTFINVPGTGAAAQVGWIKFYVGTTAYAVPYWAAA